MIWHNIDSAPKDGSWIIIWCEGAECPAIVQWKGCYFVMAETDEDDNQIPFFGNITHWMPLPDPPK